MGLKQLPDDFREFIESLNANGVEYLLVGGWAVGLYGSPRATKDIDFLVSIDEQNLQRLVRALADFGGPTAEAGHLRTHGSVFRMGSPPIQIDIINEAAGIQFADCYQRRVIERIDGVDVAVISKGDLVRNKMATGRSMDRADAEKLT